MWLLVGAPEPTYMCFCRRLRGSRYPNLDSQVKTFYTVQGVWLQTSNYVRTDLLLQIFRVEVFPSLPSTSSGDNFLSVTFGGGSFIVNLPIHLLGPTFMYQVAIPIQFFPLSTSGFFSPVHHIVWAHGNQGSSSPWFNQCPPSECWLSLSVVLALQGCRNKLPQMEPFKTVTIYSLTVLEARGLKSRCWQGHALSEKPRTESFLASPQLLGVADNLWCSLVVIIELQSPLLSSYSHPPSVSVLLCVQTSLFL